MIEIGLAWIYRNEELVIKICPADTSSKRSVTVFKPKISSGLIGEAILEFKKKNIGAFLSTVRYKKSNQKPKRKHRACVLIIWDSV
jgi:hypothetical protein